MSLLRLAGIDMALPKADDPAYLEVVRLLDAEAYRFHLSGLRSLTEWAALTQVERDALVRAGKRLASDVAALTGAAAQGPRQAAEVAAAGSDGGAAKKELAIEEAARAACG